MTEHEKALREITAGNPELGQLVDEIIYIEEQLEYLRGLPKIRVNPKDPTQQKPTAAAKLYKEFFQQYTSALRVIYRGTGADESGEESILRTFAKEMQDGTLKLKFGGNSGGNLDG